MADQQANAHRPPIDTDALRALRRRRLWVGCGLLLGIVVVCVAAIVIMLQRLEARNANFQPPMTALERERLLPAEPVLDTAPKIEGLHYGSQIQTDGDSLSPSARHAEFEHGLQEPLQILQNDDLHANSEMHSASQTN
ncbi:hypothetical protein ACIPL1_23155 [Pseudomonas sp. NPDC090202]|uniref:hypothetical protein n=1 Tax=unclassified Pseudomonas TaxID=196821 RepID=UPI0038169271